MHVLHIDEDDEGVNEIADAAHANERLGTTLALETEANGRIYPRSRAYTRPFHWQASK